MIKFQIKKKTNNIWEHFIIDGKTFILSDCYCKTNGDFFRVVEMGGSQRNEFHFSEIEVYNIGGLAETFTSSLALMQRLKSLNYVGFIREGDVVTADLISTDPSNSVVIGTDGGLFVPNFNAQSNTIINDAGFVLLGNDLTINAGWIWNINGIEYTNNFNALLTIPYASTGYNRIDLIVANNNNSFSRIEGVEDISNPTAPTQPIDTILISFINVSDGAISEPTDPIVGDIFVKKSEYKSYENNQSGSDVVVSIPINGERTINLVNPLLTSVSGFVHFTLAEEDNVYPYTNKPFTIRNNTGNPVTFKHNQSVLFYGKKIITKDALDIIIPNNEMVRFDYATEGMKDVFRSWSVGGGEIYLEVTKSELDTLITNNELIPNTLYKITGCESWMVLGDATESLYLKAISTNELSKSGMGHFYVPKYATDEIWKGEIYAAFPADFPIAPSYAIGDKVIWGGRLWNNTNGNLGTKINHFTLSADWEIVPFDSVNYDLVTDIIEYDYEKDYVFYRKDNKGSEVNSTIVAWTSIENEFNVDTLNDSIYNPLKVYQWGNEKCYGNIVNVGSILECVNSFGRIHSNALSNRGQIHSNTLNNYGQILNNALTGGSIYNNALNNYGQIHSNTLNNYGQILNNALTGGSIYNNALNNYGQILNNALTGGSIYNNTLNGGNISNNTLNANGSIYNNTFSNSYIQLLNTITQNIRNLSINANITGDLSTATLIYATYSREVFTNSIGVSKIRYFNENDVLIVADITD